MSRESWLRSNYEVLDVVRERSVTGNGFVKVAYVKGYIPRLGVMHEGWSGIETRVIMPEIKIHTYNVVEK